MHPTNQRPRKPDKLSQGTHNQTSYPRIQWENTLDKKGELQNPRRASESREEWVKKRNPDRLEVIGEHKVKEQGQKHRTTHAAGS